MPRRSRTTRFAVAAAWAGIVTQVLVLLGGWLNIFSVVVTIAAMHRGLRIIPQRADSSLQHFAVALVTGALPMVLSLFAGAPGAFLLGLVSWLCVVLAWLFTQQAAGEQRRERTLRQRFAAGDH